MENGQELDDIEIDYRLSVLKPLHATWLISLYDHMSSTEGKAVIASGWKKSGIFDAINLGLSGLPMLDPFNDICPLIEVIPLKGTLSLASLCPQELESYKAKVADEIDVDESEWEVDDEAGDDSNTEDIDGDHVDFENDTRTAFNLFEDQQ